MGGTGGEIASSIMGFAQSQQVFRRRTMIQPAQEPDSDTGGPLLVGARELAKHLGLSLRTIRRLDCSGKLPRPVKIGGAVRWRVEEIAAWLAADCPGREQWETLRKRRRGAN
jgi:prophage regulatory protein